LTQAQSHKQKQRNAYAVQRVVPNLPRARIMQRTNLEAARDALIKAPAFREPRKGGNETEGPSPTAPALAFFVPLLVPAAFPFLLDATPCARYSSRCCPPSRPGATAVVSGQSVGAREVRS